MSYTSYADARMSRHFRASKHKPRASMRAPIREIALRPESIATTKTTLVLRPNGNAASNAAYIITTEDHQPVYTIAGRKAGDRVCREFHDASGLPLFELHTKTMLGRPLSWFITMPGGGADMKIAEGQPRWAGGQKSMVFSFRNRAAVQNKREEEATMSLLVSSNGQIMARYDVIDGDRRVAAVNESIHHNETLALMPQSRRRSLRPAMDLTVVPGVDTSLVAAIAIIMFDWTYGAE
ncbi:hypothetical protein N7539_007433 [Penicillium diatomitis]|uniref:Tubby C-terminal domain-containing protein n=1 Tax=Penicillium diatomitis TaxID=2819901 RepID=A0A9X0BNU3_9EURO|nr:uncharacterized protein N7539_007433 [Penicillium diatomitis]KAJ5477289.1 hypothetical protein N7539_007433 [Penicillium diatomitis]